MNKKYAFPQGGIRFNDPAVPPRDSSVTAFLPRLAVMALVQHTGSRAYPIVTVGDVVKEGALIGRGQGLGSANIHATVPGKVVRMVSWTMAEGLHNDGLVIRLEGAFEKLGKPEKIFPWESLSPFELQRLIAEYGVVEMEGTGRPAPDLFSALRSVEEPLSLVVRCVFDDPWLAADYALCRERLAAVAEGSAIAAKAGRMGRIVIAVSYPERELGRKLAEAVSPWGLPVSLVFTSARYPQRNRRELETALRLYGKKEKVEFGSFLVLGPATLAAIHDAVKLKKPILDRYVAVGGSAVKDPQVIKARIGTRIGELFGQCGGFVKQPARIAMGSPLLGRTVPDLDEPVMKTSYCVSASLEGPAVNAAGRNCIGCGECRRVCPVGLDPEDLYKRLRAGRKNRDGGRGAGPEKAAAETAYIIEDCHGCGCCEAVCPSRLPLSVVIAGSAPRGN